MSTTTNHQIPESWLRLVGQRILLETGPSPDQVSSVWSCQGADPAEHTFPTPTVTVAGRAAEIILAAIGTFAEALLDSRIGDPGPGETYPLEIVAVHSLDWVKGAKKFMATLDLKIPNTTLAPLLRVKAEFSRKPPHEGADCEILEIVSRDSEG